MDFQVKITPKRNIAPFLKNDLEIDLEDNIKSLKLYQRWIVQ